MTKSRFALLCALVLASPAALADPASPRLADVKSGWTQIGPGGVLEARAVVEGGLCPRLAVDLSLRDMEVRSKSDGKFPTICSAVIPAGTKQAALAFPRASGFDLMALALSNPDPQRILVLGDAGCRVKGEAVQDCSKPETWPFPRLAAEAAKLRPDLVLYVGDYVSREHPCPASSPSCAAHPFGDTWGAWEADIFGPAKPLLAAAPWVMVRGNHEDCSRQWSGFMRLLAPGPYDPAAACQAHLAPYTIPLTGFSLTVMDDADAPETEVKAEAVPAHRDEIQALANAPAPTWLLQHRPIWGVVSGPLNLPVGGNLTLIEAVGDKGIPAPVKLMLSGHIHRFEAINYDAEDHVPPQIGGGFAGDRLADVPANLRGAIFQGASGVHAHDGLSLPGFGYLLMTKTAPEEWSIDVYDWTGHVERRCLFANGRVDCPLAVSPKRRP